MALEAFLFLPPLRHYFANLAARRYAEDHPNIRVDFANLTTYKKDFPYGELWWVVAIPVVDDQGEAFTVEELLFE